MRNSELSQNIKHVAIIMDGNGRWAKMRNHPRIWGHIRGSNVVSEIVEQADDCGIQSLTLYAFSTENWCRPATEVKVLFSLLKKFLIREKNKIIKNQVRFKVIGDIENLPEDTKKIIRDLEVLTAEFTGLKLTFAFGYGSRAELVGAVNKFISSNPGKEIREIDIAQNLFAPELSEIDLLIRTGGDQRISNFLLWQIAYAELYFTETKWPDFTKTEFLHILEKVSRRERRFGATEKSTNLQQNVEAAKQNRVIIQGMK